MEEFYVCINEKVIDFIYVGIEFCFCDFVGVVILVNDVDLYRDYIYYIVIVVGGKGGSIVFIVLL